MKKIGIIGGLSWESTIEYYRIMNKSVNEKLGGLHSAKIILNSFDFSIIEELQRNEQWGKISDILISTAQNLINCGAEAILIATNTLHKLAPIVQNNINVPILHIADATAEEILKRNYKKVLLLGTKYTMQEEFYKQKLENQYNIRVEVPAKWEQKLINSIIFEELCRGIKSEHAQNAILKIIDKSKFNGAEAVVLGCTELPNLIKKANLPLLNTAEIHSKFAVEYALRQDLKLKRSIA